MKIKHWQGYGNVTATKTGKRVVKDDWTGDKTILQVKVKGNHEWGLERNDDYDVWNWLVKKFDKSVGEFYNYYVSVKTNDYYIKENGLDVEVCDYTITYHKR